jgi:hypothetical protein
MVRAVVAALALVVALPATAQPDALAPKRAALKLESTAPLTISGRHFGVREPVVLIYFDPDGSSRVVALRATGKGTFKARFPIRVRRCDAFTVRATGARGSRAVLQVERRCEKAKGPPKRAPRETPKTGEG